ncbi:MAG: DUF6062 family protein [bacterium]|nr:DUF6062 family protein [bacterium]
MKEKLYTIPVNDAFHTSCECPICTMYHSLEQNAIEFTMGPSYMEDDIREITNQQGFCEKHIGMLYKNQNRLGLSLMLSTHFKKTREDLEKLTKQGAPKSSGLFKKKPSESPVTAYIKKVNQSCYVCDRIKQVFNRYLITILYLYKNDTDFKKEFKSSNGFCMTHYGMLYELASSELSGTIYEAFIEDINELYLTNIKRVEDDLLWFIDKFDYRFANEPWKNSKDALPRSIEKLNSVSVE